MKYYAGLDISLATTSVCVENEKGEIVHEMVVASKPQAISKCLSPFAKKLELVGLESGSLSTWLTKKLRRTGLPVICIHARLMAAILKTQRCKTDRNDARAIARAMRCNNYHATHVKSDQALSVKSILVSRDCLVRQRVQAANTIRGIFKNFGVVFPAGSGKAFCSRTNEQIGSLPVEAGLSVSVMLDVLLRLIESIRSYDQELKRVAQRDARAKLLMTIPGIGPITATAYLTEIDKAERFSESRQVGAYVGMTPKQYQSGEVNRYGGISKAGSRHLRHLLVGSAIVLLTRTQSWSRLKSFGVRLAKTKGIQKAAVAVGRKLAVVMHRMIMTGEPFNPKLA